MGKYVIYKIINLINWKCYIGSTVDFNRRKKLHISQLKRGLHHSTHLQKAWDKHGEKAFNFEIIEQIDDLGMLLIREQYYLDSYKSYDNKIGYNSCKVAGSTLGFKHTDKTRIKMSQSRTGIKTGSRSNEAKRNMSYAQKSRDFTKSAKQRIKTMLEKDKLIFKKIGKKSSETQKKNGLHKGIKNSNSNQDKILIFNEKNKVIFVTNNLNFDILCKENNLPIRVLLKSKLSNGKYKLYTKCLSKNEEYNKFKGWYCKYKNTIL